MSVESPRAQIPQHSSVPEQVKGSFSRHLVPTTPAVGFLERYYHSPLSGWGWSSSVSKNVTDGKFEFKEDWISRQLEAIQSKPSFTGRVSSCLLSSPPFRAAQDLLRPEKELTVLDCFPN